jgi:hypothetical protein
LRYRRLVRARVRPAALAALVVALAGCDIPLGAIRRSPPAGIDARAAAAAAQAPSFTLAGTAGPFVLSDVLTHDNALIVFYRGHW